MVTPAHTLFGNRLQLQKQSPGAALALKMIPGNGAALHLNDLRLDLTEDRLLKIL